MKLQSKLISIAAAIALVATVACDVEKAEEIYFTGADDITIKANPHEHQLQSELDSLPKSVLVRTPRDSSMSDTSDVEIRAYDHTINLGSEQGDKQGLRVSTYFDSGYNNSYNDRIMLAHNLERMSNNYYSHYTYNQYLQNYYPQSYQTTHSHAHSHYYDSYDPYYQYNYYGNYYEPVSYVTYSFPTQYCDYFRPYYSSTVNDYYYWDSYSYVNSYYTPNYVYSYYTL